MNEIDKALELLNDNEVVAMPTETVYGLAGKINSEVAIKKIFSVKERPFFDPLIVHISDISMANQLVESWPKTAQVLADSFWPGPMTLVLKKNKSVSDLITSGLESVGIRMPNHSKALELISKLKTPLAAPSANKFKKTSPTSKLHVQSEFSDEVFVIDGGECEIGIESTVIGINNNSIDIYRPGMITREDIQKVLKESGITTIVDYKESPVAPGQLEHHYMPKKPVTVKSQIDTADADKSIWVLPNDPVLAARSLYAKLRELDSEDTEEIVLVLDQSFKVDSRWTGILNRVDKAKTYNFYF